MTAEERPDSGPAAVDAELLRQKVTSSKRILGIMSVGFLLSFLAMPSGSDFRGLLMVLIAASVQHFVFHIWCDCENPATMASRHKHHVYLVMLTNVLILTILIPTNMIFARALGVLVMPIAFTREVTSRQEVVTFLMLHVVVVAFLLRHELAGDGAQWLANLAIVDAMVFDVAAAHMNVTELGRLLQTAYESSQHVSRVTVQHLLRNLCEAFVVVDDEAKIAENSSTLSLLLDRNCQNKSLSFEDFVHYDDRDEFREHMRAWHERADGGLDREDSITTTSLKVQLLDAYGRGVRSLLFFAKLWGTDGDYVYYVGICQAWQVKSKAKKVENGWKQEQGWISSSKMDDQGASPSYVTASPGIEPTRARASSRSDSPIHREFRDASRSDAHVDSSSSGGTPRYESAAKPHIRSAHLSLHRYGGVHSGTEPAAP